MNDSLCCCTYFFHTRKRKPKRLYFLFGVSITFQKDIGSPLPYSLGDTPTPIHSLSLSLFPSSLFSLRLKINFLGRPSTLPPLVFALLFLDHRLRPQIKATGRSRIPRIQGRNVDRWRIPCCSKGVTIRIISNSNVPLSAIYL